MNKQGCFLNQDIKILTFHVNLRMTIPFVTAHPEIFRCTHNPVIPKSHLYFTFCSTVNALYNIKVTVNGLFNSFGKWNEPQHTSKWV